MKGLCIFGGFNEFQKEKANDILKKLLMWIIFITIVVSTVTMVWSASTIIYPYLENISIDLSIFNWDGVAGISNAFMVMLNLILVLGIFLSYYNLKEGTKSRVVGILDMAARYIDDVQEDIVAIRLVGRKRVPWSIKDNESIIKAASLIPSDSAQRVSKIFQRLSFLVRTELIPEKYFMEMWGPLFLEMWLCLEPWIIKKRIQNKEPKLYKDNAFSRKDFEWFAAKCCQSKKQNTSLLKKEFSGQQIESLNKIRIGRGR